MQSQIPSQGLLPHSEVKKIDEQLSSGCYLCYNCWLYVIAIGASLAFLNSIRLVFTSPVFLVNVLESFIEAGFAYTMIDVFKTKKAHDALAGWVSALVCFILMTIIIGIQASALIRQFGLGEFAGGVVAIVLYYSLVYMLPAWKIKALIERREEVIKTANQYSA